MSFNSAPRGPQGSNEGNKIVRPPVERVREVDVNRGLMNEAATATQEETQLAETLQLLKVRLNLAKQAVESAKAESKGEGDIRTLEQNAEALQAQIDGGQEDFEDLDFTTKQ